MIRMDKRVSACNAVIMLTFVLFCTGYLTHVAMGNDCCRRVLGSSDCAESYEENLCIDTQHCHYQLIVNRTYDCYEDCGLLQGIGPVSRMADCVCVATCDFSLETLDCDTNEWQCTQSIINFAAVCGIV